MISFTGAFAFAWLTKPSAKVVQPTVATEDAASELSLLKTSAAITIGAIDEKTKAAMTNKQLKSLIYEVREKIEEYDSKLANLRIREQRLKDVQDTLKEDIGELDNLQVELVSTVASLTKERDKLQKSRVEISEIEQNNLISIAATYDKMAPESAGKILTSISQGQDNNSDDAVKILHYMTERAKAKLLAGLVDSNPELAAYFCKRLKQIVESK